MLIVLIHNDGTGTDYEANYDYEVRINQRTIEKGRIEAHDRSDGWHKLLLRLAEYDSQVTFEEGDIKEDGHCLHKNVHEGTIAGWVVCDYCKNTMPETEWLSLYSTRS